MGIAGQGAPINVTYSLISPNHQEEKPTYRASKLIWTDTGNYLAEGSWHLWDELPTFVGACRTVFC